MNYAARIALDIIAHKGTCTSILHCRECPLYNNYPTEIMEAIEKGLHNLTPKMWRSWEAQKIMWAKQFVLEHPEECFDCLL